MTTRRDLAAFVEALVSERRPKGFRAGPEDAETLRTAIALRAGRPGERGPDEEFVADLYRRLLEEERELSTAGAAEGRAPALSPTNRGGRRIPTMRALVGSAAAAVALVAGTVTVTQAVDLTSRTSPQVALAPSSTRFASLHAPSGSVVGEVYVHQGSPSWLFMSVHSAGSSGLVTCELRLTTGATVAVGQAQLHDGTAQLAHSVNVMVSQLRGAMLVAPGGSTVASASFA